MLTTFKLLSNLCGLSLREATDFLDVRHDTVTSWSCGRRHAPEPVISELVKLANKIDTAAMIVISQIESTTPDDLSPPVELSLALCDVEARFLVLELPYIGTEAAALSRVIVWCHNNDINIEVVPRRTINKTNNPACR